MSSGASQGIATINHESSRHIIKLFYITLNMSISVLEKNGYNGYLADNFNKF